MLSSQHTGAPPHERPEPLFRMSQKTNPYADKSQYSREDLVLQHAPLIKRIVSRMAARFPPGVDQEELIQAGMIGLLDAVDKFDPGKDVQFKTYAEFRIKGAILDELRSMDWVPRSVRNAATEWDEAWRSKASELGREPTDTEMSTQLGLSLSEYHEFLAKAKPIPLISFEEFSAGLDEDESVSLLDAISDPDAKDAYDSLSMQQLQDQVALAIETLTEQEQMVLALYYNEELNLKEIGQVLGVVESRVSQIRTKSILKLRSKLKEVIN